MLSEFSPGESVLIDGFTDEELSLKLMEMGFVPGTVVKIDREAPLGCPVCVTIGGDYQVSLRKSEAATVLVKSIIV
ncbi:ferrous iron transport protein A [Arcticibacterium luteifluviistationis]|uniref:Ferrous iron transport protein A n=1 Tax=Arcticibacterium luteifluviistationis TaxID=1784714 RepID=A0A2Z4GIE3_9BACT|nr:ferrous iron transport protein A [Arcticibacterium luteifluviistationis]